MGKTGANPPVSAVLTSNDGKIIASGFTQRFGGDHAERSLYNLIPDFHGGNLSVSLEPCTHFGKTPPCRDLVVERKPNSISIGWKDPNPLVLSGDWSIYKEQGINVKLDPVLSKISFPYLQGFLKRIQKKKPWVVLKSVTSKEGYFSELPKANIKINHPGSDFYLQMLRAKMDAVAVGPGTLSVDSPRLDFRLTNEMFERRNDFLSKFRTPKFYDAAGDLLNQFQYLDSDTFEFHLKNIIEFQPYRIFFLPNEGKISEEFKNAQLQLAEIYGSKRNLYFFCNPVESQLVEKGDSFDMNPDRNYSKDFLHFVASTSESPIQALRMDEGNKFLKICADLGINSILCESGSFFPFFLKGNMDPEDAVLEVRSQKSFISGIPFEYHNEPILSEFAVGEDMFILRKF